MIFSLLWRWLRQRLYPRSIRQLVIVGFAVVLVPLATALLTAVLYVDHLSAQSQRSVIRAAEAARNTRRLLRQLDGMERNARLYQIVDKPGFRHAYRTQRAAFTHTAHTLLAEDSTSPMAATLLSRLVDHEAMLHFALQQAPRGSPQARQALRGFSSLMTLVRALLVENSFLVERKTEAMRGAAAAARQWLLWEAVMAVPLAMLLSWLMIALLARPLGLLERSIRQLGNGELETPILVEGPRDLSELGQSLEWMRRRFRELETQKLNFVHHVSHELKTPLASLCEGVKLLDEAVIGPLSGEQREVTRILDRSTRILQRRIEDLLTFGMSESQSVLQTRQPVRVDEVARTVVAEQCLPARARDIEVCLRSVPAWVQGDADQLQVVVDNLLSNAIKHSPQQGRIWVDVQADGDAVLLHVRDQGPGIEIADSERIFEPFYQGKTSYKGHVKGTGLGLSIVKQYVRLHGGRIDLAPAVRGAHLLVRLPRHHE